MEYRNIYNEELAHHGVKGMKWGVRRYQNYDGSYTKKGLARYNKAETDYNNAKEQYKKTKTAYKGGSVTKQEYKSSKQSVKKAKTELNTAYDRLKTDKLADEGKKLYKQGKTITDNNRKNAIAQVAVVVGSKVVSNIISSNTGDMKLAAVSASTLAIGGTAVNAMMAYKTMSNNKKLRAYYAH